MLAVSRENESKLGEIMAASDDKANEEILKIDLRDMKDIQLFIGTMNGACLGKTIILSHLTGIQKSAMDVRK